MIQRGGLPHHLKPSIERVNQYINKLIFIDIGCRMAFETDIIIRYDRNGVATNMIFYSPQRAKLDK